VEFELHGWWHGELIGREQIGREKSRGQGVHWLWGGGGGAIGGPAIRERKARSGGSFSVRAATLCCAQEEGRRGKRREK
jgi:hypothetical protein